MSVDPRAFIAGLPKAELHLHLEGSIEPDLMFALARRNDVELPWASPEHLRAAYDFRDLQSFLDLYYQACRVLVSEQDFYDVTLAYLRRARADTVVHAEMFLGPQSFVERGVDVAAVMNGILAAIDDAHGELDMSAGLVVSAQRHRTEADAFALLESVLPWAGRILGFGLGGAEVGNPPRIDHGVACMDDPRLVADLVAGNIPLTVCPISNLRLNVVPSPATHPVATMLAAGLRVTINSDDPAYFGGYVNENFRLCHTDMGLSQDDLVTAARNSFLGSFLPAEHAQHWVNAVDAYSAAPA